MRCCWIAFERRGGWRLEFARDGRPDVKLDGALFHSQDEIKEALKANIVFVEMGKTRKSVRGELSIQAQNIMRENNLTPERIRKMKNSELMGLRKCGVVTMNELRNHFGNRSK